MSFSAAIFEARYRTMVADACRDRSWMVLLAAWIRSDDEGRPPVYRVGVRGGTHSEHFRRPLRHRTQRDRKFRITGEDDSKPYRSRTSNACRVRRRARPQCRRQHRQRLEALIAQRERSGSRADIPARRADEDLVNARPSTYARRRLNARLARARASGPLPRAHRVWR